MKTRSWSLLFLSLFSFGATKLSAQGKPIPPFSAYKNDTVKYSSRFPRTGAIKLVVDFVTPVSADSVKQQHKISGGAWLNGEAKLYGPQIVKDIRVYGPIPFK